MSLTPELFSQKEILSEQLKTLSENVTENDRDEFVQDYKKNVSKVTISRYLNGLVANIDLGLAMLLFFRKKIKERAELINA